MLTKNEIQPDFHYINKCNMPKEKRVLGYFALPVLAGDELVAAIDLKTDRQRRELLVQQWTWIGTGKAKSHKRRIEDELHRFERFQLG